MGSRFEHRHFISPQPSPPVIIALNQGMLPPMMSNGSYASDFSHDMPPGALRSLYLPVHALGKISITRRYEGIIRIRLQLLWRKMRAIRESLLISCGNKNVRN